MQEEWRIGGKLCEKSKSGGKRNCRSCGLSCFPITPFFFLKKYILREVHSLISFRRERRNLLWNSLISHVSLARTHSLAPQSVVHHGDEGGRTPGKHLDLGQSAASAGELLIRWSPGFEFLEHFLSNARRRGVHRFCHYFLSGEKKEHKGIESIC